MAQLTYVTFAEWQARKGIRPWVLVQRYQDEPDYVQRVSLLWGQVQIGRKLLPVFKEMARIVSKAADEFIAFGRRLSEAFAQTNEVLSRKNPSG